ncbi:MAG: ankyrin repeat domain-containing protein [Rickettsiaceae bacterium]|nr:ankyrin repeat domain-containing protein [Rickettsiaceae bacterium]
MKLVESIQALDLGVVLTCLNSGADCNFKFKDFLKIEHSIISTAIEKYLESSNEEEYRAAKDILGAILDEKPDLSVLDKKGNTVLHKLFSRDNEWSFDYVSDDKLNLMETLIELGAPVDLQNEKGELPIHFAAVRGDFRAVQKLGSIKPGLINSTNTAGETPLMVSIRTGKYLSPEFILSMLKIGAVIKVGDKSALDIAKETGKVGIVKVLKAFATEVDEKETETDTLTINRLVNDYTAEELSDLIEKSGLNVDIKSEEGLSLIAAAIYAKKPQVVKVLLQQGASLVTGEYGAKNPLFIIAMQGNEELADIVCTYADPKELTSELHRSDILLSTPLYVALQQGKLGVVKVFLQHGANPKLKKEGEIVKTKELKKLLNSCIEDIRKSAEQREATSAEADYDEILTELDYRDLIASAGKGSQVKPSAQKGKFTTTKHLTQYITDKVSILIELGILDKQFQNLINGPKGIKLTGFFDQKQYIDRLEAGGKANYLPVYQQKQKLEYIINKLYYIPLNKALDKLYNTKKVKDKIKAKKLELYRLDPSLYEQVDKVLLSLNKKILLEEDIPYNRSIHKLSLEKESSQALTRLMTRYSADNDETLSVEELADKINKELRYLDVIRTSVMLISHPEVKVSSEINIFKKNAVSLYHDDPDIFVNRIATMLIILSQTTKNFKINDDTASILNSAILPAILKIESQIKMGLIYEKLPSEVDISFLSFAEKVAISFYISMGNSLMQIAEKVPNVGTIIKKAMLDIHRKQDLLVASSKKEAIKLDPAEGLFYEGKYDNSKIHEVFISFKEAVEGLEALAPVKDDLGGIKARDLIIMAKKMKEASANFEREIANFSQTYAEMSEDEKLIVKDTIGIIKNAASLIVEVTDQFKEIGIENKEVFIEMRGAFFKIYESFIEMKKAIIQNAEAGTEPLTDIYLDGFSNLERVTIAQLYFAVNSEEEITEMVSKFEAILSEIKSRRAKYIERVKEKEAAVDLESAAIEVEHASKEFISSFINDIGQHMLSLSGISFDHPEVEVPFS